MFPLSKNYYKLSYAWTSIKYLIVALAHHQVKDINRFDDALTRRLQHWLVALASRIWSSLMTNICLGHTSFSVVQRFALMYNMFPDHQHVRKSQRDRCVWSVIDVIFLADAETWNQRTRNKQIRKQITAITILIQLFATSILSFNITCLLSKLKIYLIFLFNV